MTQVVSVLVRLDYVDDLDHFKRISILRLTDGIPLINI